VLSDNGAVFTGRYRRHGRVMLELTLHARGVRFSHSRPYHPQTCGKVERFHQTLKKWLATQPRAAGIAQLQTQLDAFRGYYKTSAHTGRCAAAHPPRPTPPGPRPPPPASR